MAMVMRQFRLPRRRRALEGIKKSGWSFKVQAMTCARDRKRQHRLQASTVVAERQRQESQSTVKLDASALAALRARYGRGGFSGEYREGECRPVAPGVECPACDWTWGNREPLVIAVP